MEKFIQIIIFFLFISLLAIPLGWADDERKEYEEEETREELAETIKIEKIDRDVLYDYGAWWRSSFYRFNDADTNRTLRAQDARLWFKCSINKKHDFYFRIKTLAIDYNKGDGYGPKDNYWITPRLDQGFYKTDLTNLIYGPEMAAITYPKIKIQIGRQYMSIGSGLVYSRVDDGAQVNLRSIGIDGKIIWAKTVSSLADIDRSRPDKARGHRNFFGLQLDCQMLDRHQPYIFGLKQTDRNKETPSNALQEYDYNSKYYGLGVKGSLAPRLEYAAEFVKEKGKSYGNGSSTTKEDIKASAQLLHLRYMPQHKVSPRITLRYLAGSGDSNRGSVTNTVGGNRVGTDDKNFLYFGYALTGYVLGPKISNLHVYSVMVSLKPLPQNKRFKNAETGLAYYRFAKDKKQGAISDLTATLAKEDIGKEIDFFLNWKVFSDFTLSSRSGIFYPGNAYPANLDEKTSFWNFSVVYSF